VYTLQYLLHFSAPPSSSIFPSINPQLITKQSQVLTGTAIGTGTEHGTGSGHGTGTGPMYVNNAGIGTGTGTGTGTGIGTGIGIGTGLLLTLSSFYLAH
jgi:hypothetical protein